MDRDEMINRIIKLQLYIQNELNVEKLDVEYYDILDGHISDMRNFVNDIDTTIRNKNRIGVLDQAILDFVGDGYVCFEDIVDAMSSFGDPDCKICLVVANIITNLVENKRLLKMKYTDPTESVYYTYTQQSK